MVNPSDDGLQRIRSGTEAARRPWWKHPATPALAAAAVLGLMAGGIAVVLGGDDDGTVVAGATSSESTSTSPSESAPDPSESSTAAPIESDVYVYYVGDDDGTPRLYREQRPNPGSGPVEAALGTMLAEPALDPDYSSRWSGAKLDSYTVAGDTATVELSDSPVTAGEVTSFGLQQIVYTVTANDKAVKQVKLVVDGTPQDEPVGRAPMVDVQGLIWLLGPAEGATVSSPVEITGYGTAFEATVSWEVRREGADKVVAEGFTQAGANGEFDDFADSVELEPGTYEIRAFESSAEDGRPLNVDSKTFTVE